MVLALTLRQKCVDTMQDNVDQTKVRDFDDLKRRLTMCRAVCSKASLQTLSASARLRLFVLVSECNGDVLNMLCNLHLLERS